jgi:hypothetical protein
MRQERFVVYLRFDFYNLLIIFIFKFRVINILKEPKNLQLTLAKRSATLRAAPNFDPRVRWVKLRLGKERGM